MDEYQDIARYYDLEHEGFRDDIEFYLRAVRTGPVLEIGVGSGRVMRPLMDAGFEVWGVDSSPAMLQLARRRVGDSRQAVLIQASVIDLDVETRFGTILLPLNVLWHLNELDSQLQALRRLRAHTLASALLIVDLTNPLSMADRGAGGDVRQRFRARTAGATVTAWSAAWDNEANQHLSLQLTYDELGSDLLIRRTQAELRLRYVFRSELDLMLQMAGFRPRDFYGSYSLDPYTADSPGLIALAEAT